VSAGFRYAGRVYWGTNGAIEVCIESMIAAADEIEGAGRVKRFLEEWAAMFPLTGAVIELDEIAQGHDGVALATLLANTLARLSGENSVLTAYGRQWAASVLGDLHAAVSATAPEAR
jgi:hypothetical protein